MHESTDDHRVASGSERADPIGPRPPLRIRSSRPRHRLALAAVTAVLLVAALAGVRLSALGPAEDGPRVLRVGDPARAEGRGSDAVSDIELVELVRTALDPVVPVAVRARLVEPAPGGQPDSAQVLGSFDELAVRSGAEVSSADIVLTRPFDGIALATVEIGVDMGVGSRARLRDLMLRQGEADWRITYETICGLAQLTPMLGGTNGCADTADLHHAPGPVTPATIWAGETGATTSASPFIEAYDASTTVRTGDWSWVVDYPDAEYGGGGPTTPAELVRVDATTGVENGRVRLAGSNPVLAAGSDGLWVLETPLRDDGTWLDPVLTVVDPDELVARAGPQIPPGARSVHAAGATVWVVAAEAVLRLRPSTGSEVASVPLSEVDPTGLWQRHGVSPVADVTGLWVLASHPGAASVRIDAETLAVEPLDVSHGSLVVSGASTWSATYGPDAVLHRLTPDGTTEATVVAPLRDTQVVWGDGEGGLWVLGRVTDAPETYSALDYAAVSRPVAVHLDAEGVVLDTWWSTRTPPTGTEWFAPLGDGLGWVGAGGAQLLAP